MEAGDSVTGLRSDATSMASNQGREPLTHLVGVQVVAVVQRPQPRVASA